MRPRAASLFKLLFAFRDPVLSSVGLPAGSLWPHRCFPGRGLVKEKGTMRNMGCFFFWIFLVAGSGWGSESAAGALLAFL